MLRIFAGRRRSAVSRRYRSSARSIINTSGFRFRPGKQGLAPAQESVKPTAGFTYNQVPPVRQSDSSRRAAILARTRSDNANPLKFRDLAVRHPKHLCKNLPVVLAQHWRGNIGAERVVRDARDGARIKMPPDDSAIDRNEI